MITFQINNLFKQPPPNAVRVWSLGVKISTYWLWQEQNSTHTKLNQSISYSPCWSLILYSTENFCPKCVGRVQGLCHILKLSCPWLQFLILPNILHSCSRYSVTSNNGSEWMHLLFPELRNVDIMLCLLQVFQLSNESQSKNNSLHSYIFFLLSSHGIVISNVMLFPMYGTIWLYINGSNLSTYWLENVK
jgi:hypothetical protein